MAKIIPLGRIAQPDDIASVAVFLASEESRHMTGQTAARQRRAVHAVSPPRPSPVVVVLVASLLVYAGVAVTRHWWPPPSWRRSWPCCCADATGARASPRTSSSPCSRRAARSRRVGAARVRVAAVALLQVPAARAVWAAADGGTRARRRAGAR